MPETDVVFRPISLLSGSETAFVCTEVLREDTARLRETTGRAWDFGGKTSRRRREDCGRLWELLEDYCKPTRDIAARLWEDAAPTLREDYGKTTGRVPEHYEKTTENVGRRPERRLPETDVVFRAISLLSGSETAFVCTKVLREDTARLREATGRARDFGGKRLWEDYRKTTANLRETLPQDYGKTLPQHSGKTTGRLQEDCRNTMKNYRKRWKTTGKKATGNGRGFSGY